MRQIEKMLGEIAEEEGLGFESLAAGWILKVGRHFMTGYHFDINNAASNLLCDDKSATYEVLTAAKIPAVPHFFYMPTEENNFGLTFQEIQEIENLLDEHKELVLKPNQGSGGNGLVRVHTLKQLHSELKNYLAAPPFLAVSPYLPIQHEYRVIILRGEVQLMYSKMITSGWKFNLGQGAKPRIIEIKENPELEKLAQVTAQALDINFASVDIAEIHGEYRIMEVNSGVMMEHFAGESEENYEIAKGIYRKAIL